MLKECKVCKEEKEYSEFYRARSNKDGFSTLCKICSRIRTQEWKKDNPSKVKSSNDRYRQNNRETLNQKSKDRYYSDIEASRSKSREYAATNSDKISSNRKVNRQKDPVRYRDYSKVWKSNNQDKVYSGDVRRRMLKEEQFVEHIDRIIVFERDQGICHICKTHVDKNDWHVDHIIPLFHGGKHAYSNVAVSHPFCNLSKGSKIA